MYRLLFCFIKTVTRKKLPFFNKRKYVRNTFQKEAFVKILSDRSDKNTRFGKYLFYSSLKLIKIFTVSITESDNCRKQIACVNVMHENTCYNNVLNTALTDEDLSLAIMISASPCLYSSS